MLLLEGLVAALTVLAFWVFDRYTVACHRI
jgi:hypothetical protein